jgi:hypothetical protein
MQLSAGSVFYDIDADPKHFYLSCLHAYVCRMPTCEYVLVTSEEQCHCWKWR